MLSHIVESCSATDVAIFHWSKLLLDWLVVTHLPSLAARCRLECLKVDLAGILICKLICGFRGATSSGTLILVVISDDSGQTGQVLNQTRLGCVWVREEVHYILLRSTASDKGASQSAVLR